MKLFRILSFALALLMLVGVLAACGKKDDGGDDTTAAPATNPVTTAENKYGTLGEKDWDGETFTVLGTYANMKSMDVVPVAEENDLFGINKLLAARNEELAELFNVEIALADQATRYNTQDGGVCYNAFVEDLESGLVTYDVIFAYRDDMSSIIKNQYLYDMNEVNYIDFSQDYYNAAALDALSLAGKQYVGVSDWTLTDKQKVSVLWNNVSMRKQYKLDDPVALVRTGDWTWAEFVKGNVVAKDLNDDGSMTWDQDKFLVGIDSNDEVVGFYTALGGEYFTVDEAGNSALSYNTAASNAIMDKIVSIFGVSDGTKVWLASTKNDGYDGAYQAFVNGRCLYELGFFNWGITYYAEDCAFQYTALPVPKNDKSQANYCSNTNHRFSTSFGIPKMTGVDTDFSGFMIEALSWKSGEIRDQVINVGCKVQGSFDADCAEMLGVCFDTVVYEKAFFFDSALKANGSTPKNVISKSARFDKGTATLNNFYTNDHVAQEEALNTLITSLLGLEK